MGAQCLFVPSGGCGALEQERISSEQLEWLRVQEMVETGDSGMNREGRVNEGSGIELRRADW